MNKIFKNLSSAHIAVIGLLLIVAGQAISWRFLKIDMGILVANVGALLLIVGLLQWLFDEESRASLVKSIADSVSKRISEHDRSGRTGVRDCITDSKEITAPPQSDELEGAQKLIIGFQYSDGLVDRYRQIIERRIAANLETEIAHVRADGLAAEYLRHWMGRPVDVPQKVNDVLGLIGRYFGTSGLVRITSFDYVLRYSFVYTESLVWLTFMTNTHLRQPLIPALKAESGTPLYEFLKRDIAALGLSV